jgi:hypothetical protein
LEQLQEMPQQTPAENILNKSISKRSVVCKKTIII